MEDDKNILMEVEKAKNDFNIRKCRKFSGSVTTEIIRKHLKKKNYSVSNRDVFIRGVGVEIDLLVVSPNAKPMYEILYDPKDVLAVLEIKTRGGIGKEAINPIKNLFNKVNEVCPDALCIYVTLLERESYRYKITPENLGYPAYTLFYHKGEINTAVSTGDWNEFLKRLPINS